MGSPCSISMVWTAMCRLDPSPRHVHCAWVAPVLVNRLCIFRLFLSLSLILRCAHLCSMLSVFPRYFPYVTDSASYSRPPYVQVLQLAHLERALWVTLQAMSILYYLICCTIPYHPTPSHPIPYIPHHPVPYHSIPYRPIASCTIPYRPEPCCTTIYSLPWSPSTPLCLLIPSHGLCPSPSYVALVPPPCAPSDPSDPSEL